VVALSILGASGLAACHHGSSGPPEATFGPAATSIATRPLGGLGTVLTTSKGSTLYVMKGEADRKVACTRACSALWPNVPGITKPAAGNGVQPNLIGTVAFPNGRVAVTYAGYPLHTYTGDSTAGDSSGQAIQHEWFVISPSGALVTGSPGS
jgi:predicted lipoprotein with Yx(FWY)xxD motif